MAEKMCAFKKVRIREVQKTTHFELGNEVASVIKFSKFLIESNLLFIIF